MAYANSDLSYAFAQGSLDLYEIILDDLIRDGYVFHYGQVRDYILLLIKNKQKDKAYKLIRWLETFNDRFPGINKDLFELYYYCNKYYAAERILRLIDLNTAFGPYVVKTYLELGNIEKAKELVQKYMAVRPTPPLRALSMQIVNHEKLGAFIETDYRAFLNNGNELEPGHIVYLKNAPQAFAEERDDPKMAIRPYMIWKIERDKLYLFPVTSNKKERLYVLYSQRYPNNTIGDRCVRRELCVSTKSNVTFVADKVLDDDFKTIIKNIFDDIYFSPDRNKRKIYEKFLQQSHREPQVHDLIATYDENLKKRRYFYVLGVTKDYYEIIEVDVDMNVSSKQVEIFRKDRLMIRVLTVTEEQQEKINSQLELHLLVRSFKNAIIETKDDKYIVIYEKGDFCICINYQYSPFWFNVTTLQKKDFKKLHGYVTDEQVEEIKTMITRNSDISLNSIIRNAHKKK